MNKNHWYMKLVVVLSLGLLGTLILAAISGKGLFERSWGLALGYW